MQGALKIVLGFENLFGFDGRFTLNLKNTKSGVQSSSQGFLKQDYTNQPNVLEPFDILLRHRISGQYKLLSRTFVFPGFCSNLFFLFVFFVSANQGEKNTKQTTYIAPVVVIGSLIVGLLLALLLYRRRNQSESTYIATFNFCDYFLLL